MIARLDKLEKNYGRYMYQRAKEFRLLYIYDTLVDFCYKINQQNSEMRHSDISRLHKSAVQIDELQFLELKKQSVSTPIAKNCSTCYQEPIKSYSWSVFTCEHNELCLECLHQYVDHALQMRNVPKCVVPKCPGQLKVADKQAMYVFTTKLRSRVLQCYREAELKNNKKCTMPDCYGFINHGTCDLCLTDFCESCFNREHRGECEFSEMELGENIRRCPECGEGIERDGGCMHIQCARCKHNFCFKCRQAWSSRHHVTCGTGDNAILGWIINMFN